MDPKRNPYKITRADRVFLVGASGSGKTTLAKGLLWRLPEVFILDPKHTFSLPGGPENDQAPWQSVIYRDIGALRDHGDPDESTPVAAIYRPGLEEMEKGCDAFFQFVYERGDCYVYVDEVMRVTNGSRMAGRYYQTVLQLGRERGVGCWSATQRPSNIPIVTVTEAEHFFVFKLRAKDDRQRMFEYTGQPEMLQIPRDPNGFWYYADRTGKIRYYRRADVERAKE